jgi:hypothetical protein
MAELYWRLDGHKPVPCSLKEWALLYEKDREWRRVAATDLPGNVRVSTVFLGLDHRFGDEGPPVLFETMVFGLDDADDYETRCSTWDEAVAMHEAAFAWAKERLAPTAINDPDIHRVLGKLPGDSP